MTDFLVWKRVGAHLQERKEDKWQKLRQQIPVLGSTSKKGNGREARSWTGKLHLGNERDKSGKGGSLRYGGKMTVCHSWDEDCDFMRVLKQKHQLEAMPWFLMLRYYERTCTYS